MTPLFVPSTKVVTYYYLPFCSLIFVQNGYGTLETIHLIEQEYGEEELA
jgi:hypothetical protein